jgi:hypothetical protein
MRKTFPKLLEILTNPDKAITFAEFEECLNESQRVHDKKIKSGTAWAILFFCAGLLALYENSLVVAVLFLALAADFNYSASLSSVQSNSITTHRLLAMLINKQSEDIRLLRNEIRASNCSREE